MRLKIVRNAAEFLALASVWEALRTAHGQRTPYLSFVWQWGVYEHFYKDQGDLAIALALDGETVRGILPLIRTKRVGALGLTVRQLQFLAKQMRREEDEVLEAIRDAMDEGGEAARRETALLHQAEHWRDRLLADGDQALADLLDAFPTADRQKLRQLVRNATDEKAKNKPPRAFRELFREVREVLAAVDGRDTDEDDAR